MDAHLFEDRTLVHNWMACPGEKEEGEFRCKQEVKEKDKSNESKKKTDSVSIRYPVIPFFKLDLEGVWLIRFEAATSMKDGTIGPWLRVSVGPW